MLIDVDIDGGRVLASTSLIHAGETVARPRVTADGRFFVWAASDGLRFPVFVSFLDNVSRQQGTVVHLSSASPVRLTGHPSAVRMFLQSGFGEPIVVAEPGGLRPLPAAPCVSPELIGSSGDGSRLFLACSISEHGWRNEIIAIASDDGRPLATAVQGFSNGIWGLVANDRGTELYVVDWAVWEVPAGTLPVLRRYDVATGIILAERVGSASESVGFLGLIEQTGRLYLGLEGKIQVLDSRTLELVGVIGGPPGAVAHAVLDPTGPTAYVVWSSFSSGTFRAFLAVVDTTTFATLAEADLPTDAPIAGIVLGPRPPRAQNLSASVAGNTVTLQWTNEVVRPLAMEILVEAGSAPGLTYVARLSIAAGSTSLVVPGVPRGTYFVRVRSANGTGLSEPSNEITIVVP